MREKISVRSLALAGTAMSSASLAESRYIGSGPVEIHEDAPEAGYDFIVYAGRSPYEGTMHHDHLREGKRIPK